MVSARHFNGYFANETIEWKFITRLLSDEQKETHLLVCLKADEDVMADTTTGVGSKVLPERSILQMLANMESKLG